MLTAPEGHQIGSWFAGWLRTGCGSFGGGGVDLRTLLTERDEAAYFLAAFEDEGSGSLRLMAVDRGQVFSRHLPDDGFLLHDRPTNELTLREARERNNLVLELSVEPPEASEEHRIRVATLVGLLNNVQTLLKHAYGAALRELSTSARRAIDRADAGLMDVVVPAAPGSFRIVLEAAKLPDLLGYNELARALGRIDTMFENIDQPEMVLERVRAHRGHLAGAFLRLLRFLVQHKTGLHYAWAMPSSVSSYSRSISETQSAPIVDLLSGVSNLGSESLTLVGRLEEADVTRRTWRIASDDGKFSGDVLDNGPSLEGLKLGATYEFSCIEEIEMADGTGQEVRKVHLTDHRPC